MIILSCFISSKLVFYAQSASAVVSGLLQQQQQQQHHNVKVLLRSPFLPSCLSFFLSFQDFRAAVQEDYLLLESLGSCMPPTENKKAFLLMISGDLNQAIRPSGSAVPGAFDAGASGSKK